MIFAATPNIKHYYEEFAKFIGQPNSVGELKSEAKDLEKLIHPTFHILTLGAAQYCPYSVLLKTTPRKQVHPRFI